MKFLARQINKPLNDCNNNLWKKQLHRPERKQLLWRKHSVAGIIEIMLLYKSFKHKP